MLPRIYIHSLHLYITGNRVLKHEANHCFEIEVRCNTFYIMMFHSVVLKLQLLQSCPNLWTNEVRTTTSISSLLISYEENIFSFLWNHNSIRFICIIYKSFFSFCFITSGLIISSIKIFLSFCGLGYKWLIP